MRYGMQHLKVQATKPIPASLAALNVAGRPCRSFHRHLKPRWATRPPVAVGFTRKGGQAYARYLHSMLGHGVAIESV